MIFYSLMFYMLTLILFLFIMYMYMMINNLTIYLEFNILNLSSLKVEFLILIDWVSLLFSSVVLLISMMVLYYSMEYMASDINICRFIMLLIMFVFSMMLLIYMPNLFSILLGWDGLGMVSYCLVIYYQSKNSYNSGMVTVLTNRVGDILILICISFMIMFGTWNIMFLNKMNMMIYFMLILASFTKSAQIPFSSWLPLAMAAPTPVSSLVHSSTLVTAGVYLLIRLNYLLSGNLINIMMLISVLTMFMAGLGANFEFDLKKIIALSTLSQLGVMVFCLSLNLMELSLFHLLTHAMFKSMLFMCAGVIIHNMLNYQDIRMISMTLYNMPMISLMFNCSSLSLCGIPFLSGFFSKDLILEMFLMNIFNKIILLVLFISMGLTVMYSIRLLYYSFIKIPQLIIYNKFLGLTSKMSISMYSLFFMTIGKGVILSWTMFSMKNMIYLTIMFKMLVYIFMFLGLLLGGLVNNFFIFKKLFIYCNFYFKFFNMLWFMPLLYTGEIPKFLKFSLKLLFYVDLSWLDFLMGGFVKIFLLYSFKFEYFYKNYLYLMVLFVYLMLMFVF